MGGPGGPRRAAVLGSPIGHSKSPALHRAAYRAAGHPDWTYEAIESRCDDLAGFISGLDRTWLGLSLTMPCKEAGLAAADWVDPVASTTGAVNTLVLGDASGARVSGYNTDVDGIVAALAEAEVGPTRHAAVLGAGATARSAVAAMARRGAKRIDVYARRASAAERVVSLARDLGCDALGRPWQEAGDCLAADVVLSTVPAGAAASLASSIRGRDSGAALLDVAYQPWPSALSAVWPGPITVSGLSMLLWQAVAQVRLMAGFDPDVAAMKAAVGL